MKKLAKYLLCALLTSCVLVGCVPKPPSNPNNIISVFNQYPSWYWATEKVQKEDGVPESVQMAIMHQESSFVGMNKTPRTKLLGFIPWKRQSSAYGYAQVVDSTWNMYRKDSGNFRASRNNFSDSTEFIGWYAKRAKRLAGVNPANARELYLAYHEGIGGYKRGSYKKKAWLMAVADKVQARANMYHRQLIAGKDDLPSRPWWHFWT